MARLIAVRFHEGDDLKQAIENLIKSEKLTSATVVSAVGSLRNATLRMAGAEATTQDIRFYDGPLEIVSLIGNLGPRRTHLHMSVSDRHGTVTGGHVKEGCTVHTTVELVLVTDDNLIFTEENDTQTGFGELHVSSSR